MFRQLLLIFSLILFGLPQTYGAQPTKHTYVVPTAKKKSSSENTQSKDLIDEGLDTSYQPQKLPKTYSYHLPLQPSLTVSLSRALETSEGKNGGWIGIHGSPIVSPTSRWQVGIDIREDFGWLQFAWHKLPTRNLSRFYYGLGLGIIILAEDELRPFLKIKNYYLSAIGGWELQINQTQNLRIELSYHQGTETGLVKGSIGYTFLL